MSLYVLNYLSAINHNKDVKLVSSFRDFLKMDKKALAKFINFFLEDIGMPKPH